MPRTKKELEYEQTIEKHIKLLGCTREEAIDIIETDKIIDKFRYATVDCYRSRIKPEEIKSWADKWGVRTNAREYMNFNGPDTVTEVTLYKNFEDVLMTLGDCGF